jgi:hypothetical protein
MAKATPTENDTAVFQKLERAQLLSEAASRMQAGTPVTANDRHAARKTFQNLAIKLYLEAAAALGATRAEDTPEA